MKIMFFARLTNVDFLVSCLQADIFYKLWLTLLSNADFFWSRYITADIFLIKFVCSLYINKQTKAKARFDERAKNFFILFLKYQLINKAKEKNCNKFPVTFQDLTH